MPHSDSDGSSAHPSFPRRVLQRAQNLLTTAGEPIAALQDTIPNPKRLTVPEPASPNRRRFSESSSSNNHNHSNGTSNHIGASIKQYVNGAITRSKSVSRPKPGTSRPSFSADARSRPLSYISTRNRSSSGSSASEIAAHSGSEKGLGELYVDVDAPAPNRTPTASTSATDDTRTRPAHKSPTAQRVGVENGALVVEAEDGENPDAVDDIKVPALLQQGTPLLKVSAKKVKTRVFRLDPDQGHILWPSRKTGIITIENIKEMRMGADARYYREQFKIAPDSEPRWLTIIYICDGKYKTLHLVAFTPDVFQMWADTLRRLHALRQELMGGLGNIERRQRLWEKRYWKGADESGDQKLAFDEVEKMCRRLNINSSKEDLYKRFAEADVNNKGYLDFTDFQRFVKLLKARPELKRLYKKLCANTSFDYAVFVAFMRDCQKMDHTDAELQRIFRKYAAPPESRSNSLDSNLAAPGGSPPIPHAALAHPEGAASAGAATTAGAGSTCGGADAGTGAGGVAPGERLKLPRTPSFPQQEVQAQAQVQMPSASAPCPGACPAQAQTHPQDAGQCGRCEKGTPQPQPQSQAEPELEAVDPVPADMTWSLAAFTSFLLSGDNSPFADHHGKVYHDMSRPLSEYFISSSHNTYLVGHQLVGDSTIEGYIRALLHGCRSVELDIWDGDGEPAIYHGRTLTSKVSLRDVCQAIAKYAFVASPYPIIISAEIHCALEQQDMVAAIMRRVFGDMLITERLEGDDKEAEIEVLPSPDDLRYKVLLKAKNLYVTESEGLQAKGVVVDTESSSDYTSSDAEPIREFKQELKRAKSLVDRVRGKKPKHATPLSPTKDQQANPGPASGPGGSPTKTAALSKPGEKVKVRMSMALVSLLVYTVGVKCRGFNKKEHYAVEHMFSLSERTANKILKQSMVDLIKHNRTHLVRVYPRGTRLRSTNFEPHKYWVAGAQLVAINWQTFDLGYMINHAMFQRNGRSGYVLKPLALRVKEKDMMVKRSTHALDITIISAQQLPRPKDESGHEIINRSIIDPFVEVWLHVPDWSPILAQPEGASATPTALAGTGAAGATLAVPGATTAAPVPTTPTSSAAALPTKIATQRTGVVKNNGFNPVWEESMSIPFECYGDMRDLIFVRFEVKGQDGSVHHPLALYCIPLGSLQEGYRHLPLHDQQLSQYLFSTLFVHISVRNLS